MKIGMHSEYTNCSTRNPVGTFLSKILKPTTYICRACRGGVEALFAWLTMMSILRHILSETYSSHKYEIACWYSEVQLTR